MMWLNGQLLPSAAIRIDPADRGFTLGDGVFETIRVDQGRAAYLARHLRRLRDGALVLDLPVPWSDRDLETAITAVTSAGNLEDAAVRITLSRGPAARGVLPAAVSTPTMLITAGPRPPAASAAHVIISTVTRRNEASPLSRIKTLNYLDSILARQDAARRGVDDAILLNSRGQVAEATAANLFVIRGKNVLTPLVADGALPGVMRSVLLERCGAVECSMHPDALITADAAFLSNSLGLREVGSIDGRPLETGSPLFRAIEAEIRQGS
jgi:branched-chain amino acid aminotransferase